MITVTAEQMKAIDHYATEVLEIPAAILMENAAVRCIEAMDIARRHSFGIFCGVGNNGGDGLAIARGLAALGKKVLVFLVGDRTAASREFQMNYRILERMGIPLHWMETLGDIEELPAKLEQFNTLIDCLFGTGLSREVRGMPAVVMEQINRSRIYTISIDMPSGVDATNGAIHGACVEPNEIITLQFMKKGLEQNPYFHCPIRVVPIGIPPKAWEAVLGSDKESGFRI